MTTPIVGTILSNNPRIEVYSGPPDPAVWRSVIFPAGNVAHCVSLEVRIVSSVPSILPSCLDCPIGANALDGTPSKLCSDVSIYIALHTHPIDSALHVAVKASRVLRCLSILSTCDHKRWGMQLSSAYANSTDSLAESVFPYHSVVVTGHGGTNLPPRICSRQCQINAPCLHVLPPNLPAISTDSDEVTLPNGLIAYYERHLFERHWSVGHNRSKQARTDADRKLLGSCKLCSRSASDQQLSEYPLSTSLDARLIPKMIQLLHDEQGHRLGLEDIRQSILQFSSHLTDRNDAIWAAWHEASYLHAVAASPSGDALHIPRRRHFRPRSRLPGKIRYYAVRVGRETGIFPSWKDARRHVDGFSRPEYGSFKTREAAEAFLSATPVVSQSPLPGPSYSLFTDGSASTSPPFAAGWGLHILDPTGCVTHEDWGPVCLDPSSPEFVGASRYTNNSGELTALISAFKWIYSDYAQKHLLFSKTLPSANKGLITEARRFLDQARSVHSLSLVWTKAHTKKISMVASGNRKADSLALLGRRELARSLALVDLLVPRLSGPEAAPRILSLGATGLATWFMG
eukprot:gene20187-20744_t